jgi:hypothetical protein
VLSGRIVQREAVGAEIASEVLAKQHLDIRLVVDHKDGACSRALS